MRLLDAMVASKQPVLVITDPYKERAVLRRMGESKVFKAVQFMHVHEFLEKILFRFEDRAVFEAARFFDKKPEVVEPWLKFLYLIEASNAKTDRLRELLALKDMLVDKRLITKYDHTSVMFKNKTILVDLDDQDALVRKALTKLSELTEYEDFSTYKGRGKGQYFVKGFSTVEAEVAVAANTIRQLIADGVPFEQLQVVCHVTEYTAYLRRIFYQFGLPFNIQTQSTLWQFGITQRFFEVLTDHTGSAFAALTSALEAVKPKGDLKVYRKIMQVLNPLVYETRPIEALFDEVLFLLKHTTVKQQGFKDAVCINTMENIDIERVEYLFVLGAAETYFPVFSSENDILSKDEKTLIGYDCAETENLRKKQLYAKVIESIPNAYFSYAMSGVTEQYYRATFLEDAMERYEFKPWEVEPLVKQVYAVGFDKVLSKEALDDFLKYGQKTDYLTMLYPRFKDDIVRYDNRFQSLRSETLSEVLKVPLKLSYSRLNVYFSCKFRFLLEALLKVDQAKSRVAIDLGNFFHRVLEEGLLENELSDAFYHSVLESIYEGREDVSHKSRYFLSKSIEIVKDVIEVVRSQHQASSYEVEKRETRVEKGYQNAVLSGIIDKVLVRKTDEAIEKYVLLDYKTGQTTLNLKHAYYGLNAQLLFYVILLLHETGSDVSSVSGFYEQTLLMGKKVLARSETETSMRKEALKWQGYTVHDVNEALMVDHNADEGSFIRGMRFKKAGDFDSRVKTFDVEGLNRLVKHLEKLLDIAITSILSGDFAIDPKRDQTHKDLSCAYCSFKDVCYKRSEDYQTLEIPDSDSELFSWLADDEEGIE